MEKRDQSHVLNSIPTGARLVQRLGSSNMEKPGWIGIGDVKVKDLLNPLQGFTLPLLSSPHSENKDAFI